MGIIVLFWLLKLHKPQTCIRPSTEMSLILTVITTYEGQSYMHQATMQPLKSICKCKYCRFLATCQQLSNNTTIQFVSINIYFINQTSSFPNQFLIQAVTTDVAMTSLITPPTQRITRLKINLFGLHIVTRKLRDIYLPTNCLRHILPPNIAVHWWILASSYPEYLVSNFTVWLTRYTLQCQWVYTVHKRLAKCGNAALNMVHI